MNMVQLRRKTIVDVTINNRECEMVIDSYTIDHFQRSNNIGILKFYQSMKDLEQEGVQEITPVMLLLASIIRDKKTKEPVGIKWLDQFDFQDVAEQLQPVMDQLFVANLPNAKGDEEKKPQMTLTDTSM